MASPQYVQFKPRWMSNTADIARLADTPNTGFEPEFAPRLPTRLVPNTGTNSISAITLIDVVGVTQKIVYYSAQEAAYGVQFEFSDLRSVPTNITELAKLHIQPFEPGSFVIPAVLEDRSVEIAEPTIAKPSLSSHDILVRFSTAIEGVAFGPEFAASIGLVNAVDELGRVLRREASAIEYYPSVSSVTRQSRKITVDATFVSRVKSNLNRRLDLKYNADEVSGLLIAVDISRATLKVRLSDKSEIKGSYEKTAANAVISSLNKRVALQGVIGRQGTKIDHIRVITCEAVEE